MDLKQSEEQEVENISYEPRYVLLTAISSVFLCLAVGAGVWFYMNGKIQSVSVGYEAKVKNLEDKLSSEMETTLALKKEIENSTKAEIEFKTYSNQEIGFQIQIPSLWEELEVSFDKEKGDFKFSFYDSSKPQDQAFAFSAQNSKDADEGDLREEFAFDQDSSGISEVYFERGEVGVVKSICGYSGLSEEEAQKAIGLCNNVLKSLEFTPKE